MKVALILHRLLYPQLAMAYDELLPMRDKLAEFAEFEWEPRFLLGGRRHPFKHAPHFPPVIRVFFRVKLKIALKRFALALLKALRYY